MSNQSFTLGIVGLGVMGRNFALNVADNGYSVIGLDKNQEQVETLKKEAGKKPVNATTSTDEFLSSLDTPRSIMLLVPAGDAVDSVIDGLLPNLNENDLIIDAGNSHFKDTNRRYKHLKEHNIHFMGVGVSGGEKGARFGPSIMPGGSKTVYGRVQPIFEDAAARVNGEPCVTWLGPGSAGHYVKMVHNGIEYGLMQLIAECYDLMKRGLGFDNDRLHEVFSEWNEKELSSYLMEITDHIFTQPDEQSGGRLIDVILDSAKQKGTGEWDSQDAMELQAPTPTIDLAVAMRNLSSYKEERVHASQLLEGPDSRFEGDPEQFVRQLRNAMYFAMITTYAQGMGQLYAASLAYNYDLHLDEVAKIWRGGCIIRADLLEDIRKAFNNHNHLPNLMVDPHLSEKLKKRQADLRSIVGSAARLGIAAPGMMTSLAYYDGYRSKHLPTNLVQAQRDFFGSHTYERVDAEGQFHTEWND